MTGLDPRRNKVVAETEPTLESLQRTVRIEHDRKRLALAVLASGAGMLALLVALAASIARVEHSAPGWTLAPLGLAILLAALGFLRNIVRLQDGDPALVISPRGLSFRPQVFGEPVRIPWTAIRGFRSRSYKHIRFIAVQVDDADRYVSRAGFLRVLHRLGKPRAATNEIGFSTPMAKPAWKQLEIVLQGYLAQYGSLAETSGGRKPDRRRGSAANPAAGIENPRSVR
jgi:uncharacterized integral membrane protein